MEAFLRDELSSSVHSNHRLILGHDGKLDIVDSLVIFNFFFFEFSFRFNFLISKLFFKLVFFTDRFLFVLYLTCWVELSATFAVGEAPLPSDPIRFGGRVESVDSETASRGSQQRSKENSEDCPRCSKGFFQKYNACFFDKRLVIVISNIMPR